MENSWSSETLFHTGDEFFSDLCGAMRSAVASIDVEIYIFQNDALGRRMVDHLKSAAARGVRVRVMVDGFGSSLWEAWARGQLEKTGAQCSVHRRIPSDIFLYLPIQPAWLRRFIQKLQRRNHRKLFIVDQKTAWIGSMNIAAYHLREFSGLHAWRDTGARVSGEPIEVLNEAFDLSWSNPWTRWMRPKKRSPLVRTYHSRRHQRFLYKDFLRRIRGSRQRVWLTTAYFTPTGSLLRALREASRRGVDTRILTTEKTDVIFFRWIRSAFYYGLLKCGVKIYEYRPSVMHAKCALIDDFAMVGSTNLDSRSLFHNLEVDVVLQKRASIHSMERRFLQDLEQSTLHGQADWKSRPLFERLLGRITLLFKYWL